MDMTNKDLDQFVSVTEGSFVGVMYKINDVEFVDGSKHAKLDYDVINLDDDRVSEFEAWLGESIINAIIYAVENAPQDEI